jgi:hypothetical protein
MRQPPAANHSSSTPSFDGRSPEHAAKQELLEGLEAGTVEFQPFFWDLRNQFIRSWEQVQTTRYFWRKWTPVLGPTYTVIIINFRLLCADRASEHQGTNKLVVSHTELSELTGISLPSIKRMLAPRTVSTAACWFLPLFLQPYRRYTYDPQMRKKVRAPNGYRVAMDDPLLPEDEELLRGQYAEEEIRQMIRSGVVDLNKYAEIRSNSSPKDQFDPQVARPKDQFDPQVADRPKDQFDPQVPKDQIDPQVQPLVIARNSANRPKSQDQIDPQVDQFDPQVQPLEFSRILPNSARGQDQIDPHSSSSSSSSRTATTAAVRTLRTASELTPDTLIAAVVQKFGGSISKRMARKLIEQHGLETVHEQLEYFDFRDNSWADKGPAAAFVTYCRDRVAMPEAYAEKLAEERERQEEEQAWRASPLETRLEELLSRWGALYGDTPAPRGEQSEPLEEEVEAIVQLFLDGLQRGMSKQELDGLVEREIIAVSEDRGAAAERYDRELEQALAEHRDALSEEERATLTEAARQRAVERGGEIVKRFMPKPMLRAIEQEILCERARASFPSWSEFWQQYRAKKSRDPLRGTSR